MTNAYLSEEASIDLSLIWKHYAERVSIRVADESLQRILETVGRTIVRHARSGRRRHEFGANVYSFPVVPHVVFYLFNGQRVRVLRILHGHRDIHPPLMSLLTAV
jgi:plasmid stabilization system protein ParE